MLAQQFDEVTTGLLAHMGILLVEVVVIDTDSADARLPGIFVVETSRKASSLNGSAASFGVELFDADGLGLVVAPATGERSIHESAIHAPLCGACSTPKLTGWTFTPTRPPQSPQLLGAERHHPTPDPQTCFGTMPPRLSWHCLR